MKVIAMKVGDSVMVADQVLVKIVKKRGSELNVLLATTLTPVRMVPEAVADRFIAGLRRPPVRPAGLYRHATAA